MKIQQLLMNLQHGLRGEASLNHFPLGPPYNVFTCHFLHGLNSCHRNFIYISGRRLSTRVIIGCNRIHNPIEDEWAEHNSVSSVKDEFDASLACKKFPSIIIGSSPSIELYDGASIFSSSSTESCWGLSLGSVGASWGVPSRLCNTWSSLSISFEEAESSSALPTKENIGVLPPSEHIPVEIGRSDSSVDEKETYYELEVPDSDSGSAELFLDRPIISIPGLTRRQCHLLEKNDFHTVRKLLNHFPRTYADLQNANFGIHDGQYLISIGHILSCRGIRAGSSFAFLEVVVGCENVDDKETCEDMKDGLGGKKKKMIYLHLKKFFRGTRFTCQPFLRSLEEKHKIGDRVCVSGKVKSMATEDHYEIREYNIDVLEDERDSSLCSAGRPYPIYPSKGGLNPAYIRDIIQRALQTLSFDADPIPKGVTEELGMLCLRDLTPHHSLATVQPLQKLACLSFIWGGFGIS